MSAVAEAVEDAILRALDHPERRQLLKTINGTPSGVSYSELLLESRLSTGKLNYQLRQLGGLIEKTGKAKYTLTPLGRKGVALLSYIAEGVDSSYEAYVQAAGLTHKSSLAPLASGALKILIFFDLIILSVWAYIGYIALTEGAPLFVLIILPVLIIFGIGFLVWLLRTLRASKGIIETWEKRNKSSR